jgi:hypothetical protein
MEMIWLVLALLAVDVAALLFAADTRPGLQHSARSGRLRSTVGLDDASRPGVPRASRWPARRHPASR